jgi:hypothetical protein
LPKEGLQTSRQEMGWLLIQTCRSKATMLRRSIDRALVAL